MAKKKTLSADALRVLRTVAERGLRVTWRYRVPRPYYEDTEEAMPHADWNILTRELEHVGPKTVLEPLGGKWLTYTAWESAYFRLEETENNEYYVENRYHLTDHALALIRESSDGQP